MADFRDLGAALGGDSEQAYQQGRFLGARTEDALAAAAERSQKNAARQRISQTAQAAGVPKAQADLLGDAAAGDINLGEQFGGLLKQHELNARNVAGDPTKTFSERNIALQGIANAPVDRYQKIGRGVDDRFDEAGVTDLGSQFAESGSKSTPIQVLEAFGLIDPATGMVPADQRERAFNVYRDTVRNVDAGGVPLQTMNNPFASSNITPVVAPNPAAPAPAPSAAPGPAPAAPRTVAPVETVADNARRIAAAKEQGGAQGRAAAGLPSTLSTIDKFSADIDAFLKMPGFEGVYGNLQGTAPGAIVSGLASQDIANAQGQFEALGGEAFLASIQKMRGFGQLSNAEGAKVQTALTRAVNSKIGSDEARRAWAEVQTHLQELKRVAQIEAQGAAPAPAAPGAGGVLTLEQYLQSKGH